MTITTADNNNSLTIRYIFFALDSDKDKSCEHTQLTQELKSHLFLFRTYKRNRSNTIKLSPSLTPCDSTL